MNWRARLIERGQQLANVEGLEKHILNVKRPRDHRPERAGDAIFLYGYEYFRRIRTRRQIGDEIEARAFRQGKVQDNDIEPVPGECSGRFGGRPRVFDVDAQFFKPAGKGVGEHCVCIDNKRAHGQKPRDALAPRVAAGAGSRAARDHGSRQPSIVTLIDECFMLATLLAGTGGPDLGRTCT